MKRARPKKMPVAELRRQSWQASSTWRRTRTVRAYNRALKLAFELVLRGDSWARGEYTHLRLQAVIKDPFMEEN